MSNALFKGLLLSYVINYINVPMFLQYNIALFFYLTVGLFYFVLDFVSDCDLIDFSIFKTCFQHYLASIFLSIIPVSITFSIFISNICLILIVKSCMWSETECSICREKSCDVKLACTHNFHWYCISRWRMNNTTCPLCRETMTSFDESKIYIVEPLKRNLKQLFSIQSIIFEFTILWLHYIIVDIEMKNQVRHSVYLIYLHQEIQFNTMSD